MSWFTRFTRFGDAHLVYGQEATNSCGIACVMMCVFKVNKLEPSKTAFHTEQEIYKVYGEVAKTNYDGSAYSDARHLATVLNRLNCGTWSADYVNAAGVSDAIIGSVGADIVGLGPVVNTLKRGYPIIILVGWNAGGAHFVVVDTVNSFFGSLYASVCDPGDADVHITPFEAGKSFNYIGAPSRWTFDFGTGVRGSYQKPTPGVTNGWVVRRTD